MCQLTPSKKITSCNKGFLFFLSTILLLQVLFPQLLTAQGNLLLMPKRIVFEGTKRYEEINIANTGTDTARYAVSFLQFRMKEDGGFTEITKPDSGQRFSDNFLRFFPRSVYLAPNEAQVIKIQLTKTNELQPGEYRSHLYFRAIPIEKALGVKDVVKDSSISVKITAIFGISIPVIIRVGENTTQIKLTELSIGRPTDTTTVLALTLNRIGNMSVYGDISVDFVSPEGKTTRVGTVNGLAVYTPTLKRQHHMELLKIPGIDYHSGKLHIVYKKQPEEKSVLIAEGDLELKS